MDKKKFVSVPTVGGSFLLVIFAVLCLTVFAMLTLSTVQASGRLSEASARAVEEYYRADCQAESILAQLRRGEIPPQVQEENGVYRYTCVISDTQNLQVAVRLTAEEYKVLQWQAVSVADWQPDDRIEVWNGEAAE